MQYPQTNTRTTRSQTRVIEEAAAEFHKEWLKTYREKNGNKERVKNGQNINVSYYELNDINKFENFESAKVAFECIKQGLDIERSSAVIHSRWVDRNKSWASDHLKQEYNSLSDEEKNKDRNVFRVVLNKCEEECPHIRRGYSECMRNLHSNQYLNDHE